MKRAQLTTKIPSDSWRGGVLIAISILLAVTISLTIGYATHSGRTIFTKLMPLMEASGNLRFHAAMAELWFKEAESGNREEAVTDVEQHLESVRADTATVSRVLTEIRENLTPTETVQVQGAIDNAQTVLQDFKELAEHYREVLKLEGFVGDYRIESMHSFSRLLDQAEALNQVVAVKVRERRRELRTTVGALIGLSLLFTLLVLFEFNSFRRQRASHYAAIEKEKETAERSGAWLRVTLESMGDGVISTDTEGRVTYMNPVACGLTGWEPKEAIGADVSSILNLVDEATRTPVENPASRVLRDGKVVKLTNHTVLLKKDGGSLHITDSGAPIRGADGTLLGAILVFSDVTEEKRIEEERIRLAAAVEYASDMIILLDKDQNVRYVNPAFERISGFTREDVAGKSVAVWNTENSLPLSRSVINNLVAGKSWRGRLTNKKKDGSHFETETSISPIFTSDGAIVGYVNIKRDVTREVQLERQLNHASKMEAMGRLAGGIAHDFNNILTAVLGYTELGMLDTPAPSPLRETLEGVKKAALRAKELVRQILTFSRQGTEEKHHVQLTSVVKEALSLVKASLPPNIQLVQLHCAGSDTMLANATQIHQVVMNLCTNAADAMGSRGGCIDVVTENVDVDPDTEVSSPRIPKGKYVAITVRDTGPGIDPLILDKIFDPFFTTKEQGKGTGLGLSLVHGIVRGHGGDVTVESTPGQGTTFRIYFPLLSEQRAAYGQDGPVVPVGEGNILLVDDEESVARTGAQLLQTLGYSVTALTCGEIAVQTLRCAPERFDLLIIDQVMPCRTGVEIAGLAREIKPDLPVILSTGGQAAFDERSLRNAGIDKVILKPFLLQDMGEAVKEVLAGAKRKAPGQ